MTDDLREHLRTLDLIQAEHDEQPQHFRANHDMHAPRLLEIAQALRAELDRTRAELATARGQLLHFAAEAHRRKWTYDTGDEGPTPDAFAVLHTIGNELRAAAVSAPTD